MWSFPAISQILQEFATWLDLIHSLTWARKIRPSGLALEVSLLGLGARGPVANEKICDDCGGFQFQRRHIVIVDACGLYGFGTLWSFFLSLRTFVGYRQSCLIVTCMCYRSQACWSVFHPVEGKDRSEPCTTKAGDYPIIHRVLTIPGGCLGFLNHKQYEYSIFSYCSVQSMHGHVRRLGSVHRFFRDDFLHQRVEQYCWWKPEIRREKPVDMVNISRYL